MLRKISVGLILPLLGFLFTTNAHADTALTGQSDGGAFFKIIVPDAWNGDLVIWNHGFSLGPIGPVSNLDLGPLAQLQLVEGYAVAASSYQQRGWSVFKTNNDLQNLVDAFKVNFGMPNNVILTGASLGGTVTVAAVEKANLGNVAGAYTFCGANAGSRNWDGALDLRLIYDAVCDGVPGASIPGGAQGLPANSTLTGTGMALAVHACTGILAPPPVRTPAQSVNLAKILGTTQIPESFLLTTMGYVTFAMADLVHDNRKLNGKVGTNNIGVDYGDTTINAAVERVSAHKGAANLLAKNYSPNGHVGATKHVALHTDKDGLVVVENQSAYAALAPAANYTVAVAIEEVPSHCIHSPAEVVAGWESLRAWLAGAPQPSAADIQGTCLFFEPFFGGPCRINPAFVIPNMDGRIRPR